MKKDALFLGVDTSNYTTSLALCNYTDVILNCKVPLNVKSGEKGLRQSDAVFNHVKNLPIASEILREKIQSLNVSLTGVGCSATPRDVEGSYMPCFLTGLSAAELVSSANNIPLYKFSHQAGHIMAAITSACRNHSINRDDILSQRFVAFHISGGTTEVLLCEPDLERIINISQIGGTRDINAGQLIDRTGVMMQLRFPCGAEIDKSALSYGDKFEKMRLSVSGMYCNLSGGENQAQKLIQNGESIGKVSSFVLDFVARTLEKITINVISEYGNVPIFYSGGVMSSQYIRKYLCKYGMFADSEYSSDNAVGVALLASEKQKRLNGITENE